MKNMLLWAILLILIGGGTFYGYSRWAERKDISECAAHAAEFVKTNAQKTDVSANEGTTFTTSPSKLAWEGMVTSDS